MTEQDCDPMRITKKFTFNKCVFRPRENASPTAIKRPRREIVGREATCQGPVTTWRRRSGKSPVTSRTTPPPRRAGGRAARRRYHAGVRVHSV